MALHWQSLEGGDAGEYRDHYAPVSGTPGMGGANGMPNPEDFYSGGDQWTQKVELSPEMQAIFDQQNKIQQGMFGAQDAALGRLNQSMSSGFDMSGLPQGGTALNTGSLPGMGTALDQSKLPGLGSTLDTNDLPGMGTAFNPTGEQLATYDPTKQTNNAAELIMSRTNPELDRQYEQLRSQLANQGIVQGSAAYDREMDRFGQQRNDAANQAALAGIGLGMQQQGLQFNQGLQNRQLTAAEQAQQFAQQNGLRQQEAGLQNQQFQQQTANQQLAAALQNQQFNQQQGLRMGEAQLQNQNFAQSEQARQRAFQEQAYLRNLPLQELQALTGGNQVTMPNFPGYAQQATTGGANLMGAAQQAYSDQLGAYNAQQAESGGMLGGLFGLAGAGIGGYFGGLDGATLGAKIGAGAGGLFSDRRLKTNIKRVGTANNGLGIYSYQYVWGSPVQLGFMADEVEQIAPHAVGEVGGFKTVNYGVI